MTQGPGGVRSSWRRFVFGAPAIALVALGIPSPVEAGLTLAEICAAKGKVEVTSVGVTSLTGPEVLNHLPGPSASDFGDRRILTADDGIHPGLTLPPQPGFSPIFGCPNDLQGVTQNPTIRCGVPGGPRTKLLHGTTVVNSQESSLHAPESDQLSLAVPGHGSYSFIIATVGQFRSLSYLAGTVTSVLSTIRSNVAQIVVTNVTLGGTTLAPNVLFQGPFNADLMSIGPGNDIKYDGPRNDETGESIVRGCNGLAGGVDGIADWFPTSEGPFPKFPNIRKGNRGTWVLASDPDRGGRVVNAKADTLAKVPTSAGFFVTQDVAFSGYIFPIDEAEALTLNVFRPDAANPNDLPDIKGFPDSGKDLAKYFVDVITPKARENRNNRLVSFLRGIATVQIIGINTILDITIVGAGDFGRFDFCGLDVSPCTF